MVVLQESPRVLAMSFIQKRCSKAVFETNDFTTRCRFGRNMHVQFCYKVSERLASAVKRRDSLSKDMGFQ